MGNAYTVVVAGGVGVVAGAGAADEVVVGGGAEDDVVLVVDGVEGEVVTHKDEALVGVSAHTPGQAVDSVFLPGSGLAAEL